MKLILTLSTAAMISAGIYGVADLARDLHNGTMIKYEGEEETVMGQRALLFSDKGDPDMMKKKMALADELKKKNEVQVIDVSNISYEDFSRGEPIYVPELESIDSVLTPENPPVQNVNSDPKPVTDSASTSSAEIKPEQILRLYSRAPLPQRGRLKAVNPETESKS